MKASELMIGDWVKPFGSHEGVYAKITSITPNRIDMVTTSKNLHHETEEYTYPVPLTPEILEKNGFKLNPQGSYSIGRNISIDILDGHYNANMNTNNPQTPSFLYQVGKYVHELQHALRLCGIEKNIEL